jgi:hypothetical protein
MGGDKCISERVRAKFDEQVLQPSKEHCPLKKSSSKFDKQVSRLEYRIG